MASKICRAVQHTSPIIWGDGTTGSMVEFLPENGDILQAPVTVHPDEDGMQWYWTPEEASPDND